MGVDDVLILTLVVFWKVIAPLQQDRAELEAIIPTYRRLEAENVELMSKSASLEVAQGNLESEVARLRSEVVHMASKRPKL